MSRPPSMTTAEAETEIASLGFSRPIYFNSIRDPKVKDELRKSVRKWLSAKGLPSAFACGLAYIELEKAFNDPDGKGFEDVKRKYDQGMSGVSPDTNENETAPQAPPQSSHGPDVQQVAALLAQLLAKGALDKDGVNAVIDERLKTLPDLVAKYAQVHRVELVRQDGTTHKVEGHAHPTLATPIQAAGSRQENGKHPNIMLCGPTGSGKTHSCEQAAKALGLEFYTNGAISMDYQLIGFKDAAGHYHETPLRKAFERAAWYLFDEIDSSQNSPLLSLSGALANNGFAFPDAFVKRHADCVITAAGNTWGNGATADFVGRNKIDGAIKSRFPVRIAWDYDEALERNISGNVDWACRVQKARTKARAAGLKVIIDPRMTQAGAGLIAAGFTSDKAAELTYLAELSAEQRKIVEA